jgi:transposase
MLGGPEVNIQISLGPSMISFDESRIFIVTKSVDMRKGIDGPCLLLIEQEIAPETGGLYLFSNRSGRILKGLVWDRNGFILIYKRIENSRFKIQFDESQESPLELSHEQLRWLLAGLDYT